MADISAREPSWYPTFPYTRTRGFSLENLGRDASDWWYESGRAAEDSQRRQDLGSMLVPNNLAKRSIAQDNPERYIRDLIAEVEAAEAPTRPNDLGSFGPPMLQTPKTGERREADAKRAKFIEGMLTGYGVPKELDVVPPAWDAIDEGYGPGAGELKDAMMKYATNTGGYRSQNNAAFEPAGLLGPGSGLNTAMTWAQSTPAMLYAAGEAVAAAVDPESAADKDPGKSFMRALNTFSAPGQALAGAAGYASPVDSQHSAWSGAEAARKSFDAAIPWHEFNPEPARQLRDSIATSAGDLPSGRQYFMNRGVPAAPAAVLGGLADDLFNPFLNIPGLAAASKLKTLGPVTREALTEFGPGLLLNGLGAAQGAGR